MTAPARPGEPVDGGEQDRHRSARARAGGPPRRGSACPTHTQVGRRRRHGRARLERADGLEHGRPNPATWPWLVCSSGGRQPRSRRSRRAPRARHCRRRVAARWRRAGTRDAGTGRRGSHRRPRRCLLLRARRRRCCAAAAGPRASNPTTARRSAYGALSPAMSPSTITASTGCGRLRASCAAPAAPIEALVEASTTERCCVCAGEHLGQLEQHRRSRTAPRRRRASSAPSRGARRSTIVPDVRPASVPVTVWIVREPSTVCAVNVVRLDLEPVPAERARHVSPRCRCRRTEPGGRTGNCFARLCIVA